MRSLAWRTAAVLALLPSTLGAALPDPDRPSEDPSPPPGSEVAFHLADPRVRESSGLVASHIHDGVFYTTNDSGPEMTPDIYAVNGEGQTVAVLRIAGEGVEARDWESVAVGTDDNGEPAIFVGDIGDNFGGAWPNVRVYRVPEPANLVDQTLTATTFTLTFADGGRDAEGMFVDPRDNRLYVVSKEVAAGLYAAPERLSADGGNELTRVAPAPLYATGASVAPDGATYAIRTYWGATVYDASDGVPGPIVGRLTLPEQEQGEGIAHTRDGSAVLVSSEGVRAPVWRVELPEEYGGAPEGAEPEPAGPEGEGGEAAPETGEEVGFGGTAILVGVGVAALAIAGIVVLVRRA